MIILPIGAAIAIAISFWEQGREEQARKDRIAAARKAVEDAKAAYDAKFADPRDPAPEARQMRYAIVQARKALRAAQKTERPTQAAFQEDDDWKPDDWRDQDDWGLFRP
jgi:hypothetical protein